MGILKEVLSDYKELYEKSNKFVEEESRDDPPTDPYRSHYKARDVLKQLRKLLEDELVSVRAGEADGGADELCLKAILASVLRDLGRINVYVEEVSEGDKILKECIELIEPHKQQVEAIIPYLGAVNEMSIVHGTRKNYKEACELLQIAEKAFLEFKATEAVALSIVDLFSPPEQPEDAKGPKELENLFTLCSFYMAQVYGHLGEAEKSAECCHRTLQRQLQYKSYDAIDFALNTATLSQYYIGEHRFKEARHHLAAATLIMTEHEAAIEKDHLSEQQRADKVETFKHRYADVARCWAKYGLFLLQTSKERLMCDDDDEDKKLAQKAKILALDESYRFEQLDLSSIENRVTSDYCLTFDDAKPVFHFINEWLDVARAYYKAETEATEYAKITQDYAEAYEYIAFFEEDPENQAKMHKRRAKYLEDLLDVLNHEHFLKICRECWYGAGTAYAAVLDIRLDMLKEKASPDPEEVKKVNQSCLRAIKNFEAYVKSYHVPNGDEWKSNMDADEQRTMLYAHFHIGRLYYKLISGNPLQLLEQLNNSLKYYKKFTDECTARKEVAEPLHGEVGVVREMLQLLPLKIKTVKARLPSSN